MDENRFEEILVKNLTETENRINKSVNEKIETILVKKLTETEERINKRIDDSHKYLEQKIDNVQANLEQKLEDSHKYLEQKIDDVKVSLEEKINDSHKYLEQKIIDNGFYFEHTYGEKISAIFDKLQLNDDLKKIDEKENKKIQKQIEKNSAELMSHELRISKIEKEINSKKVKI